MSTIALVEASADSTHYYSSTYLPRMGMPTLGAVLARAGHACDIWFQAMPGFDEKRLFGYDIVCISSLSNTIDEAYRLADALTAAGRTVIMGGAHVSFLPDEALDHCPYVVIGEGEDVLPALVDALARGGPLDEIRGLAYRHPDGRARISATAGLVDFERLPSPDFSLSPQVAPGNTPPIVTTSRGCPHDCSFCSVTSMFGRKYRFKSSAQVIEELRPLKHRSVFFGDDNIYASPRRAKALLRDLIAADALPLRWSGQMTVKAALDEEFLGLLRETRCRIMYIGIESVDPETLKGYGKAHQADAIAHCIENMHRYGIGVHGMFVVNADDGPDAVKKIVDYAIATDIDTIQICALTPFPGTAAYDEFKGRLLHTEWKYFDGMHVVVDPSACPAYELQMAIVRELKRFYSLTRVLGAYRRGRAWRLKYRAGGYYIARRWVRENREYLSRLRDELCPRTRTWRAGEPIVAPEPVPGGVSR
ncbi:MAG TPA: radical SAM protein [Spirochaetota bacterium]|nr:radical SAM protein [Spirochaetota bacterium]